jgi:hypothetical protein
MQVGDLVRIAPQRIKYQGAVGVVIEKTRYGGIQAYFASVGRVLLCSPANLELISESR